MNNGVRNTWPVLLVLCLGNFMSLLDATIVNVAIPTIMGALHAGLDQLLLVVNAFLIVYAALLIPSGRLGDIYGPRRLFTAGLLLFTAASAACGLSQSAGALIGCR